LIAQASASEWDRKPVAPQMKVAQHFGILFIPIRKVEPSTPGI
jgi:hypothetical protein